MLIFKPGISFGGCLLFIILQTQLEVFMTCVRHNLPVAKGQWANFE